MLTASRIRNLVQGLLCVGLVASAGAACLWLVTHKPQPRRQADVQFVPSVEVVSVRPVLFNSPIIGYGTIRPKRQIKIIPQVSGQIIQTHKDLAVGNFIAKGDLLFEIDPRSYQAKLRQAEAETNRLHVQLKRYAQERSALDKRLQLALSMEKLAKEQLARELDYRDKLADPTAAVPLDKELAEANCLRQQEAVLTFQSQLDLLPIMTEETQTLLATAQAQLEQAKLMLEGTKIYCPCDVRVDMVDAQAAQMVTAYFAIAVLTDMEALELLAVIDPRELRWSSRDVFASAVGQENRQSPLGRISWTLFGQEYSLHGPVTRLERVDEMTRTAHVVVEIRDVLRVVRESKGRTQPPLSVGMFCKAELPTEPLEDALLVPRHAIQDGKYVYVFEPLADDPGRGRLDIKSVPLLRSIGEEVLVDYRQSRATHPESRPSAGAPAAVCELKAGDRLIVSPLARAVEGMQLQLRNNGEQMALYERGKKLLARGSTPPSSGLTELGRSGVR